MSLPSAAKKFFSLGPRGWALLVETLGALVVASMAVRALPFRTIAGAATRRSRSSNLANEERNRHDIGMIKWAVEAVAARLPWRTLCFQKGLAAHLLLKRRGIPTQLHYGIDNRSETGLRAHVWVTSLLGPVIGTEVADEFTCVATFPPAI